MQRLFWSMIASYVVLVIKNNYRWFERFPGFKKFFLIRINFWNPKIAQTIDKLSLLVVNSKLFWYNSVKSVESVSSFNMTNLGFLCVVTFWWEGFEIRQLDIWKENSKLRTICSVIVAFLGGNRADFFWQI